MYKFVGIRVSWGFVVSFFATHRKSPPPSEVPAFSSADRLCELDLAGNVIGGNVNTDNGGFKSYSRLGLGE